MMTETSDKNCASDGSSSCSSSQKTSSLQAPCGEILDKESYNPAYHNGRADIKAEGINDECKAESDETEDYDGSMYDSYSSVSLTRDSHSNEMLIILRDTVITNDRNDETRAVRSLPVGLTIKASNLTDEKRVFTQALLPSAVTFGPFGGKIKQDMDSPNRFIAKHFSIECVQIWQIEFNDLTNEKDCCTCTNISMILINAFHMIVYSYY
jgi:hypothetical protein